MDLTNTPHQFEAGFWDPDSKYSQWRRNYPFRSKQIRKLYCTDIDWVEWRGGRPVAIVETTRCGGKPVNDCAGAYMNRNNGFQAEVAFTVADKLKIPAYLVLIDDKSPGQDDDYSNTVFYVGRLETKHLLKKHGIYQGADAYLDFLRML